MNKTIMFLGMLAVGFANAQEGKVGINTESLTATLNVKSKTGKDATTKNLELVNASNTKLVTVLDDGKVGIRTSNPQERLHTMGGIRTQGSGTLGGYLDIVNSSKMGVGNEDKAGMWRLYNMTNSYVNGLHFWAYPEDKPSGPIVAPAMVLTDTGNVGIGTSGNSAPTEKLHIAGGNVRITELPKNIGSDTDKVVVVDNDGVLKSIDRNSISNNEDEWSYDATTNRVNLKRSATFDSKVFYNRNGAYINQNMDSFNYVQPNTGNTEQEDIDYDVLYTNTSNKKVTSGTYLPLQNGIYRYTQNANKTYIEDTSVNSNIIVSGTTNSVQTAPSNTKNYNLLRAVQGAATHDGSGDAKYLVGGYFDARINKGTSTGYLHGIGVSTGYASDKNANRLIGINSTNNIYPIAIGKINEMTGINSLNYFNTNQSLEIGALIGMQSINSFAGQGNLTIKDVKGILYAGLDTTTVKKGSIITVDKNYGIYIGDVKGATTVNYAIYTNGGKVHLGDELEVKGSIKVASTTTNDNCTSDKAGTIRFDATNKKFQGCTGTDWKDLHN